MTEPEATPQPTIPTTPPVIAPMAPPSFFGTLTPDQQNEFRVWTQALLARVAKPNPMEMLTKFAESEMASAKVEAKAFEERMDGFLDHYSNIFVPAVGDALQRIEGKIAILSGNGKLSP